MPVLLPRRTLLKGLAAAPFATGSSFAIGAGCPVVQAPYPAALRSRGLSDWVCVFNPDLTQPVSQVIGPDAARTPLSYRGPANYGTYKSQGGMAPFSTGPKGLSMRNTQSMQGSAWTMDNNFTGRSWGSPVYFEASYTAPYIVYGTENWVATFFAQSEQAYNPAYGGNPIAVGTRYNRCEFDMTETATRPDLGSRQKYLFYSCSVHSNTGNSGPAMPDVVTGTGNTFACVESLWDIPVTWSGLWGDGTRGTTNECQYFLNNYFTGAVPTPASWTSPAPNGPPRQWLSAWMDIEFGTRPATYSYVFTLHYIRVWKPADCAA